MKALRSLALGAAPPARDADWAELDTMRGTAGAQSATACRRGEVITRRTP
jgi:hypothetical protein